MSRPRFREAVGRTSSLTKAHRRVPRTCVPRLLLGGRRDRRTPCAVPRRTNEPPRPASRCASRRSVAVHRQRRDDRGAGRPAHRARPRPRRSSSARTPRFPSPWCRLDAMTDPPAPGSARRRCDAARPAGRRRDAGASGRPRSARRAGRSPPPAAPTVPPRRSTCRLRTPATPRTASRRRATLRPADQARSRSSRLSSRSGIAPGGIICGQARPRPRQRSPSAPGRGRLRRPRDGFGLIIGYVLTGLFLAPLLHLRMTSSRSRPRRWARLQTTTT